MVDFDGLFLDLFWITYLIDDPGGNGIRITGLLLTLALVTKTRKNFGK